jgi:hypothetical protein
MNNDALDNKRVLLRWINFGITLLLVLEAVFGLVLFLKP